MTTIRADGSARPDRPLAASTSDVPPTGADRVRQGVVLVGALLAVLGAAWGSGAFGGTTMPEVAGGAFAPSSSPLTPATGAFSIWSVIYLGLVALAVYQALPRQAADPRLRATSWWVLASLVLNAVWIAVVQAEWLWASVAVLAGLLGVLAVITVRLVRTPSRSTTQSVLLDATLGLYTGWASVATLANVVAVLVHERVVDRPAVGGAATVAAVVVLVAGVALAWAWAALTRGRPLIAWTIAGAMAWGFAWIAVARTTTELTSTTLAVVAAAAAVLTVAAPLVVPRRSAVAR